ncbi:hypothetical protein FACS1894202_07350 [Clostridia bacterium]|nr:hypothetical protein FACS1894202_07350 [Clostridia bacterium]
MSTEELCYPLTVDDIWLVLSALVTYREHCDEESQRARNLFLRIDEVRDNFPQSMSEVQK